MRRTDLRQRRRRGFTLVEIMIVVAIMGILAAIVFPKFVNATDDARESATKTQLRVVRTAVERYQADFGVDPTMTDWTLLITNKYLKADPVNPSNGFTAIAGSPGANVGWVWRKPSATATSMQIYATAVNELAEFTE
ncbi:MAG: prepilin-type N-terminal cleavage/methylation domain-containing protein [Phycisphaerales bacterium]|nr:prepilin-type N-terminal cleavage/methylation domain-containing protein [Phycisphaerales bacterium]